MKKTIFTLLFLCFYAPSFSYPVIWGFNIYPKTNSITSNPIFIIEGYSASQEVIANLNIRHKIYLWSFKEIVPLTVEKSLSSGQVILKPIQLLKLGETYELRIDNLDEYNKGAWDTVRYQVNQSADTIPPEWYATPIYHNKIYEEFYCGGGGSSVYFCGKAIDTSPIFIYVKITEGKKTIATYYLPFSNSGLIDIGSYTQNEIYEVSFSLMDASGNKFKYMTEKIPFRGATINDKNNKIPICDCEYLKMKELAIRGSLIFISIIVVVVSCLYIKKTVT